MKTNTFAIGAAMATASMGIKLSAEQGGAWPVPGIVQPYENDTVTNYVPDDLIFNDIFAQEGDHCGGFDEISGDYFPDCAEGLKCVRDPEFQVGIPGLGNVCAKVDSKTKPEAMGLAQIDPYALLQEYLMGGGVSAMHIGVDIPTFTPRDGQCISTDEQEAELRRLYEMYKGDDENISYDNWVRLLQHYNVWGYEFFYGVFDTVKGQSTARELDFIEFLQTLAQATKQSFAHDGSFYAEKGKDFPRDTCVIYERLTDRGLEGQKLKKVTYSHIQEFESGGDGSGSYTRTINIKEGRTHKETVSHAVMLKLEANAKWTIPLPDTGFLAQYDYSQVIESSNKQSQDYTQTINLDLAVKNFVYVQKIDIEYKSGARETIIGGGLIINRDSLPGDRVVTYARDGKTVETDKVYVDGEWTNTSA